MAPVLPEVPADPDLRFAESNAGDASRKAALELYDAWAAIEKQIPILTDTNKGVRIDRAVALWQSQIQRFKVMQDNANAAAVLADECAEAARKYRASAPSQEEFDAKKAEYEAAFRKVQETADAGGYAYVAAKTAQAKAQAEFGDLIARKKSAVAEFEHAEDQATKKFKAARQSLPKDESETPRAERTAPRSDAPAPAPTPKSDTPTPAPKAVPDPGPPAPVMPPMPQLSPTSPPKPETVTSSNGGSSRLDPNKLLTAMALQQAMQPPQPAAQPQPQMAPQMFQPQPPQPTTKPIRDEEGRRDPLNLDDIAQLVADGAPGAAVIGGLPLGLNGLGSAPAAAPAATPGIVPVPAAPTYTPAAPWSLSSPAPANPVVTGTSVTGLQTDNNVTGRPDNVASRTAYTPAGTATATGSHLAGTQAGGAVAGSAGSAGTATGAAPGMGAPMIPPMMMGPGGGGGGDPKREPVTAQPGSDSYELSGGPTVDAAVPGGTIAQNRDDAA